MRTATTKRMPPGSDTMNEKDDEIAHLTILARTAKPQELRGKP